MTLHLHLAIWMKVVSTLELLGEGLGDTQIEYLTAPRDAMHSPHGARAHHFSRV